MAARKQRWHPDEVRKRIQTTQILKRLNEHTLSEKGVMNATQITAANILLRKVLPDLATTELKGDQHNPIQHNMKIQFVKAGE